MSGWSLEKGQCLPGIPHETMTALCIAGPQTLKLTEKRVVVFNVTNCTDKIESLGASLKNRNENWQ